ncbi:MAG TPA: hypothetical protein PKX40_07705 [Spirochaetota bacterium]|nr:hypothetical protein [Spirochaetota bacterium]
MWTAPEIGLYGRMTRKVEFSKPKSFIIIGCLRVIGLYNLVFFILR